jgi:hypothetical protein
MFTQADWQPAQSANGPQLSSHPKPHCPIQREGMSTSKKQKAGKASGVRRAASAKLRQLQVLSAYERLRPPYQDQPYSKHSLDELENELRKEEQRRAALQALEKTLDPPLSDDESVVEIIEDPARVLQKMRAEHERKELSSEEVDAKREKFMRNLPAEKREAIMKSEALLFEAVRGFLDSNKEKKRKTAAPDHSGRETLIKHMQALGIRSKRQKKRSR